MTDPITLDADSEDFDRVHWAKCQARAERYEEEVQLTVEEMGRTLKYFEWKRDWWLSLASQCDSSNYPRGVPDGLHAYAHRQSHIYNELTTLYVTRWRPYLSSCSLGSPWLSKYPSHVDLGPVRPSRGHRKLNADPVPITGKVPVSNASTSPKFHADAPLDSASDDDFEGGTDAKENEDLDVEDMFADD